MESLGLLHLYYGDGKGKTTAAMGLALRALGSGKRVVIVQFLKGGQRGELPLLEQLGAVVYRCKAGQKFVFQMNEAEKAATRDLQNKNLAAALAQPCMLSRTAADALLFMVCFYWYSGNSRVRRRTRSLISSFFSS